jgi:hypothetical protein
LDLERKIREEDIGGAYGMGGKGKHKLSVFQLLISQDPIIYNINIRRNDDAFVESFESKSFWVRNLGKKHPIHKSLLK